MRLYTSLTTIGLALALSLSVSGCGGGGSGSSAAPLFERVDIELDGRQYKSFTDPSFVGYIDNDSIILAKTDVSFKLQVANDQGTLSCYLLEMPMKTNGSGNYQITIKPAYFNENISLQCWQNGLSVINFSISLKANDPILTTFFSEYLRNQILVATNEAPSDLYSGYRRRSYYAEINRFLSLAELYSNPDYYGIGSKSELYKAIESHLINTAEAFFEPCVNYDFYAGDSRQCRSTDRIGPYYLWRSPTTSNDEARIYHAKVEWRAAAGIAQAIKAILLNNPVDPNEICLTEDNPSAMIQTGLVCRALNVRRLLYQEIWQKWNDKDWVSSVGLSNASTISGTIVPHYIAWAELIADLFAQTANIQGIYDCDECGNIPEVQSRKSFLLDFFYTYGEKNQFVGHSCAHPDEAQTCPWEGYDFAIANSSELSHSNTTVHLLSMYDGEQTCDSAGNKCVDLVALARTMDEEAWAGDIPNGIDAKGFPKFDMFINGYCRKSYPDETNPLHQFCRDFWLSETEGWLPHRRLIGFVNLGMLNRSLMIKLRQSADNNQDGLLERIYDGQVNTYLIFLYRALVTGGNKEHIQKTFVNTH